MGDRFFSVMQSISVVHRSVLYLFTAHTTNNLVERQFLVIKRSVLKWTRAHGPLALMKKLAVDYMSRLIAKLLRLAHGAEITATKRSSLFWLATGNQSIEIQ